MKLNDDWLYKHRVSRDKPMEENLHLASTVTPVEGFKHRISRDKAMEVNLHLASTVIPVGGFKHRVSRDKPMGETYT